MTLGNSPQPLTRRQLRELAREQEPATADAAQAQDASAPEPTDAAPADTAPAKTASDRTAPEDSAPENTPAEASVPASAPENAAPENAASENAAPAPHHSRHTGEPASVPAAGTPAVADPRRTLTRRELRALQVAASASAGDGANAEAPDSKAPDSKAPDSKAPDSEAPQTEVPAPVQAAAATPRSASVEDTPTAAPVAGLHPPVGHWSVDRDENAHLAGAQQGAGSFDDLVGRGIGAGGIPTTTNALILPAIPRQGTGGPITSTGEIMITGSLDLPRSLGATGQLPNLFDSSEMDRMLDQLDEGGHHNDVAPVSASRAVSTHTSTRGVMTPPRKRGASLPTVLAITAAVLAIGVLSLFVIGYAVGIY